MKTYRKKGVKTTEAMGCSTPGKRGYETEDSLKENLCRDPKVFGWNTYQCKCGLWHVASKRKRR